MSQGRPSAQSMDTYIAPNISRFTAATIPNMAPVLAESRAWLSSYILNTMLRYEVPTPEREYRFNFVRLATIASSEYDLARNRTLPFLSSGPSTFTPYFEAVHHWEQFLAAVSHAMETVRLWTNVFPYNKGDGSTEERVNLLYNAMKHTEDLIRGGAMPKRGPLTVWLTNDGLQGTKRAVSYQEAADILHRLAEAARKSVA